MRLDPKPGERILDLATGTGWTSRILARRGAKVTGVDISEKLVDAAIARAKMKLATQRACRSRTARSTPSHRPAA